MKIRILAWAREVGGAERQLVNLAHGLLRRGHEVSVVVFFRNDSIERRLVAAGVPHDVLGVRGRWDFGRIVIRYLLGERAAGAEIVYAYLLLPNVLSVPVKLLGKGTRIVWGLRMSDPDLDQKNGLSRPLHSLEVRLSRFADLVIANSHKGREDAIAQGFEPAKLQVVDNGIDTSLFRPRPELGLRLRAEWGIGEDQKVIGLIARLAAKKDHMTFLRAAALAAARRSDLRFVCVGDGPPRIRNALGDAAEALGVEQRIVWARLREDMVAVYNAFDVNTLSSAYGEGFPNALGEAMACGVPCVTTDSGDARRVVGDTGVIVRARRPDLLAEGWLHVLSRERAELGRLARQRVEENFGVEQMVASTERLLRAIV
jgi:glycosyltransferase involved in cell wall biosynthesis